MAVADAGKKLRVDRRQDGVVEVGVVVGVVLDFVVVVVVEEIRCVRILLRTATSAAFLLWIRT